MSTFSSGTPNPSDAPSPDEALLRNLLDRVAQHEVTVDEAMPQVRLLAQHSLQTSGAASMQAFANMLRPALQRQAAMGPWIAGIIFALIGTIFFIVGAGFGWRSLQFVGAPSVVGVIVDGGKAPTAKYVVNNQEFRVTAQLSVSPPPFRQGEKCTVLYQADDPAHAQIDYFTERWLMPLVFGGIGAVFGLTGWGLLLFKILGRLFRPRPVNEAQRFTIE